MRKERRKFPRVYIKIVGEYKGANIWQQVIVDNISLGGMFVITDKVEPKGTEVEFIFKFGRRQERIFMVKGVVVWCREKVEYDSSGRELPPGMGIEFRELPTLWRKFLQEEIDNWEG